MIAQLPSIEKGMVAVKTCLPTALVLLLAFAGEACADYQACKHSGSLYLLTTPEGANLSTAASVEDFPLLVRLHKDFFDFARASGLHAERWMIVAYQGETLAESDIGSNSVG